jgi:hypothetical protein
MSHNQSQLVARVLIDPLLTVGLVTRALRRLNLVTSLRLVYMCAFVHRRREPIAQLLATLLTRSQLKRAARLPNKFRD